MNTHELFIASCSPKRNNFPARFSRRHRPAFARFVVGLTAVLFALQTFSATRTDPPSRPNILWIIGDDLGVELGCYGLSQMRTPNIDRLASEGARFTRCFTTAPVCSPSRSALMTGMYQTTINAHDHRSMTDLPPGVKPITEYFRQAGYFTANVKKIAPGLESHAKTDFNFKTQKPFDGNDFDELKSKQPFFAEINFTEPHRGSWKPAEKLSYHVDPKKVELPPYYPDDPVVREDWAKYLDTIDYLDGKVGQVLALLEAQGLASNTVVFFFSDNGRCHVRDKQWLYEPGLHIPLVVRWPGQIQQRTVRTDLVSAIDISATSLSIAGVQLPAGMQGRTFLGSDARKRTHIFGARDRCDETVDRIRSVRDQRYKYIRNFMPDRPYTQPNAYKERAYPALAVLRRLHADGKLSPAQQLFMASHRPEEELYDLQEDPDEIHNLAKSAEHQKVLRELREALEKWMAECDDRADKHGGSRQ
jgi:arylsulfatase A-like enzyme